MKNKIIKMGLVVGLALLLIGIPSAGGNSLSDNDVIDTMVLSVEPTEISFGAFKVIATVENTGQDDAEVTVTFSVSKGRIIPWIIGTHDVTVPVGDSVEVPQDFSGFGRYSFFARIEGGGSLEAKGFWFFFFGIKTGQITLF
jgi:hypothetical protein